MGNVFPSRFRGGGPAAGQVVLELDDAPGAEALLRHGCGVSPLRPWRNIGTPSRTSVTIEPAKTCSGEARASARDAVGNNAVGLPCLLWNGNRKLRFRV